MTKKILYIDLDNTLVDFQSSIATLSPETAAKYQGRLDEVPGIFAGMQPMPGAIDAYHELAQLFDTYIDVQGVGRWCDGTYVYRKPSGGSLRLPSFVDALEKGRR